MNYSLRKAGVCDAESVMSLVRSAMLIYSREAGIPPQALASLHENKRDVEKRISEHDCFCLFDDTGTPAATLTLTLSDKPCSFACSEKSEKFLSAEPCAVYISRFAVSDSLRGTGLGVRLIDTAAEYARDRGCRILLLHTALTNDIRTGFYVNRGFLLLDSETSHGYPRGLFFMPVTEAAHA